MPDLMSVQQEVAAALADSARIDDAVPLFAGDGPRVRARLAVYRNNVSANAMRALSAAYPIVRKLVGAEFFEGLARAYCDAYPSTSGDINEFGAQLAQFLAAFPPAQALPYLPDVARLEWLAHRAHYAADHPALDSAQLRHIDTKDFRRLRLKLHPAVGLLESRFPIYRIWEVHQDNYRGEVEVDLGSGAQSAIIYRPRFRAVVAVLASGELEFLDAIQRGEPLHRALDRALAVNAGFDLAACLQQWAANRIVVDLRVDQTLE